MCDVSLITSIFTPYTTVVSGVPSVQLIDSTTNNKNSNSIVKLTFNVRKLPTNSFITINLGTYYKLSNHFIHAISYSNS